MAASSTPTRQQIEVALQAWLLILKTVRLIELRKLRSMATCVCF